MAYTRTEDELGRQVKPVVVNESEAGTGTWHVLTCNSSGALNVAGSLHGIKLVTKTSASPLTTGTLFNWAGSVQILSIIGRVTTVIQAQITTCKLGIQADALTIQDMCATLDINGFLAGSMLGITGTYADAMTGTTGVPTRAPTLPINATCITSGIIKVTYGAASTGAIVWELLWIPLNAAGSVTAA